MKHGGWKAAKVARAYCDTSLAYKKKTAEMIGSAIKNSKVPPNMSNCDEMSGSAIETSEVPQNTSNCDEMIPTHSQGNSGNCVVLTQVNNVPSTASSAMVPSTGECMFSFRNCTGTINITYHAK